MHLPEFVLLVIATIAAIAAGLAVVASNYHMARILFWIAALSFGSLGVVWAASSDASLAKQMVVAAVVAAIAAAGLVYGLWELRTNEPKGGTLHSAPKPPASEPQVRKNSPNISAGGTVNIGHIGDVINQGPVTPNVDLSKNEGVLVPSNLPTPPLPHGVTIPDDGVAALYGSNVSVNTTFPHTILEMRGEPMIVIDRDLSTKNLVVTALKIFDDRDDVIASIDPDGFWVQNAVRKKRPDEHTLIVYDHNGQQVLKIQFLNPQVISIEGIFRSPKTKPQFIIITEKEMIIMPNRIVFRGGSSRNARAIISM